MPSIAVVVLDTLRYDRFDEHFSWLDGLRFTNAYSTSHWTGSSHASLFTGRYPSEVGTTNKSRTLDWQGTALPEALREAGYTTRNFTTNLQTYVWNGWERGFDERAGPSNSDVDVDPPGVFEWRKFSNESDETGVEKYARGMWQCLRSEYPLLPSIEHGYRLGSTRLTSAKAVSNRVRNTTFGDREFLLLNLMDAHGPYYPPKEYRPTDERLKPTLCDGLTDSVEDRDVIRRAYDGCARYLSDMYRGIFEKLSEDFEYVVTLSDHGELLGERGLWAHAYGLYPELTHVPLVVSGPDVPLIRDDDVASILDVHRTVADLAGLDVDSRGQNLLDDREPVDRLVEYHGLPTKRRKIFAEAGIEDRFERMNQPLDAVVSADGYAHETHDDGLTVTGALSPNEATRRLAELVANIERQELTQDDTDVSGSVQRRLEELGYV